MFNMSDLLQNISDGNEMFNISDKLNTVKPV
jgi:hypothetical protein